MNVAGNDKSFTSRAWPLVLVAVLGVSMTLGGHLSFASATSTQSFNNVQIFVSPQNSSVNSFEVSAYNITGGLVASTQTSTPQLPSSFQLVVTY